LPDKEPAAEKTVNIGKKGLTSVAQWQIKRPVLALCQVAHVQNPCRFRGHSSAGRAPALQAGGRRFDPVWLHQILSNRIQIKYPPAMLWLVALCAWCLHRLFERSAIDRYANIVVEIIKNDFPPTTLSIIPFIGTLSFAL
jgi:hypothetical protein